MSITNICHHSFLQDPLSSSSFVIDCGVNHGEFSSAVSSRWGCTIHGLEPDPRLYSTLPQLQNCTFHPNALFSTSGTMELNLGHSKCSSLYYKENSSTDHILVKTISLPELCKANNIPKIDLLKLDIEGAEIEVLNQIDDSFYTDKISQLTVEFHEFLDPSVISSIHKIIDRLQKLGFYYFQFSRTFGDVLFVNSNHINLSKTSQYHILLTKYLRGSARLVRKSLGHRR